MAAKKESAGRGSDKKAPAPKTKGDDAKEGTASTAKRKTEKVKPTSDKPNALQQKMRPSPELADVIGTDDVARGEAVSRIWEYIRKENLQDDKDRRNINADERLHKIFGKKQVTMFEMNKYLSKHLQKIDA